MYSKKYLIPLQKKLSNCNETSLILASHNLLYLLAKVQCSSPRFQATPHFFVEASNIPLHWAAAIIHHKNNKTKTGYGAKTHEVIKGTWYMKSTTRDLSVHHACQHHTYVQHHNSCIHIRMSSLRFRLLSKNKVVCLSTNCPINT